MSGDFGGQGKCLNSEEWLLKPLCSNSRRAGGRIVLLNFRKSVGMHSGHEWVQEIRQGACVPVTSQALLFNSIDKTSAHRSGKKTLPLRRSTIVFPIPTTRARIQFPSGVGPRRMIRANPPLRVISRRARLSAKSQLDKFSFGTWPLSINWGPDLFPVGWLSHEGSGHASSLQTCWVSGVGKLSGQKMHWSNGDD
ncbi:hypothetical protein TNCV_359501 [Trichonephila clavipes]|nr:hypothetical protein TNCV_359501 [Trichonephila clavipes]